MIKTVLFYGKRIKPVDASGMKRPVAEGTLENLIFMSAEGARRFAESLRPKDRAGLLFRVRL